MKKEAYEDSTIYYVAKRLRHLQNNCSLTNPEAIKTFVANKQCTNAYKESLIEAYAIYMKSIGQKWNQPFYQRYDRPIKVPTEEKIDMLISHSSPRMALILSMSKDLGTRPIELTWLKVSDIDLQNRLVSITGAKHTIGRVGKLRPNTLEMLEKYSLNQKKTAIMIFGILTILLWSINRLFLQNIVMSAIVVILIIFLYCLNLVINKFKKYTLRT